MSLSTSCIAKLFGVSKRTVKRCIQNYDFSITQSYSNVSDEELGNLVKSVKDRTPNVGYRMMKGILQAMGHCVQWKRVSASLQRVDSTGLFRRITRMGCVASRRICNGPLHLVHVTNHKLIQQAILLFTFLQKLMKAGRFQMCDMINKTLQHL